MTHTHTPHSKADNRLSIRQLWHAHALFIHCAVVPCKGGVVWCGESAWLFTEIIANHTHSVLRVQTQNDLCALLTAQTSAWDAGSSKQAANYWSCTELNPQPQSYLVV